MKFVDSNGVPTVAGLKAMFNAVDEAALRKEERRLALLDKCRDCGAPLDVEVDDIGVLVDEYEDYEDVDSYFGEYRRIWVRVYEVPCPECGETQKVEK